jgi:hypothetical protein
VLRLIDNPLKLKPIEQGVIQVNDVRIKLLLALFLVGFATAFSVAVAFGLPTAVWLPAGSLISAIFAVRVTNSLR